MAIFRRITCDTCGQKKDVQFSSHDRRPPTTCYACLEKKTREMREKQLDAWAKDDIDTRLRRIEEFMYDHSKQYHPKRPFMA